MLEIAGSTKLFENISATFEPSFINEARQKADPLTPRRALAERNNFICSLKDNSSGFTNSNPASLYLGINLSKFISSRFCCPLLESLSKK